MDVSSIAVVICGSVKFCRMVTVGDGSMSEDQLVENIVAVVIQLATALPGGAANIHRLHIKTENSMALPIFSSSSKYQIIFYSLLLYFLYYDSRVTFLQEQ